MITPDIDEMKEAVDKDLQVAIEKYFKSEIRHMKEDVHAAQDRLRDAKTRAEKYEDKLRNITSQELREKFFEVDIVRQESPYQAFLKGKS